MLFLTRIQYQQALSAVASVLAEYDSDKIFHVRSKSLVARVIRDGRDDVY